MENKLLFLMFLLLLSFFGISQDLRFRAWNGTDYDAAQGFPANGVGISSLLL